MHTTTCRHTFLNYPKQYYRHSGCYISSVIEHVKRLKTKSTKITAAPSSCSVNYFLKCCLFELTNPFFDEGDTELHVAACCKLYKSVSVKVAAVFWVNSEHVKHNSCMRKSPFSSIIQLPSFEIWLMYDWTGLNFRLDFLTRVFAI